MPSTPAAQRTRHVGERIKARRLELGITQSELAGDEYTRGFISQVENGLIAPSLAALQYIAERLGRPVAWFLEQDQEQEPGTVSVTVTQEELHRVLRLRLLSDGQLEVLERLAGEFQGATAEELEDTLRTLRWLRALTPRQQRVLRVLMREFLPQ